MDTANPVKSSRVGLRVGIILLTLATAIIHLALGLPNNFIMFTLNGLGYMGLLAALYLPPFARMRKLIRWGLIAYTAVTVIAWVFIGQRSAIGYIDKVIEVLLITLLFLEGRE